MPRKASDSDRFAPTPAFLDAVMLGREIAENGDLQGAETLFLRGLATVRGRRDGDEILALRSLVTVYGLGGRYFESLILARRLADLTRVPGAEAHLVYAYGGICGSLNCLYLTELLDAELEEMEALLELLSGPTRSALEKAYHEAGAGCACYVGDLERTRLHLAGFRRAMENDAEPAALDRWIAKMYEAEIALMDGQPDQAIAALEYVERHLLTPPDHRLQVIPCWIRTCLAAGDPECAARHALEGVELLRELEHDPFHCSERIHQGAKIAHFLGEDLDLPDVARRAYDLVAAAVVVRIAQLDEAVRNLPELGSADTTYAEELIAHRKRFVADQRTLMARVADLMRDREDELVQTRLGKHMPDDFIAICAWCERVRPEPDTWIPVGHYVPRDAGLRITHTLCPTCAQRMV